MVEELGWEEFVKQRRGERGLNGDDRSQAPSEEDTAEICS